MIPREQIVTDAILPDEAIYWTPREEDLGEDSGFGFFCDT